MVASTSLSGSIYLYQLVNDYYKFLKTSLPDQVYKIPYENLVKNPSKTLSDLLNFLELSWEDDVLNNQATALTRAKINTTSYDQVVEPLYTTSIGKFEDYSPYIGVKAKVIQNINAENYEVVL